MKTTKNNTMSTAENTQLTDNQALKALAAENIEMRTFWLEVSDNELEEDIKDLHKKRLEIRNTHIDTGNGDLINDCSRIQDIDILLEVANLTLHLKKNGNSDVEVRRWIKGII
tara:strand:+ start:50 stop:388 length:339 start_codon:yes stop_codon:yes gene_type:complete